jgi:hypothetical protein
VHVDFLTCEDIDLAEIQDVPLTPQASTVSAQSTTPAR